MFFLEETVFLDKLKTLGFKEKVILCALLSEHLFHDYVSFNKETNWGSPIFLKEGLNVLWDICQENNPEIFIKTNEEKIKESITNILSVIPDPDDFNDYYSFLAINSAAVLVYTLEYCLLKNEKKLELIAYHAEKTVLLLIEIKIVSEWNQDFEPTREDFKKLDNDIKNHQEMFRVNSIVEGYYKVLLNKLKDAEIMDLKERAIKSKLI